MKIFSTIIVVIIVCLSGLYAFTKSGIFNVAATTEDGPFLSWILHTTMEHSVEKRARNVTVPDLESEELILTGVSDYAGMCAQCHGEPGQAFSPVAQGLNPRPPGLSQLAESGSAAEQFWIIQNGIRMTGMPAYGATHGVDEIWPVVAFLQSSGRITSERYNELKQQSSGYGHHAHEYDGTVSKTDIKQPEEVHDHATHEHPDNTGNESEEHDHSTHVH